MSSYYRKSIYGCKLKDSLNKHLEIEILKGNFNMFITLTTNYDYKRDKVIEHIEHWKNNLNSRIFRSKRFYDASNYKYDKCFKYFGFLEYTALQHVHYHLIAYVHPERQAYFERIAPIFWKKLIKQGSSDIQLITDTPDKLVGYVLKNYDKPVSYQNLITS